MFKAVLDGEVVTIVDVDINGQMIYVAYIDNTNTLKATGRFLNNSSFPEIIATNVVI